MFRSRSASATRVTEPSLRVTSSCHSRQIVSQKFKRFLHRCGNSKHGPAAPLEQQLYVHRDEELVLHDKHGLVHETSLELRDRS